MRTAVMSSVNGVLSAHNDDNDGELFTKADELVRTTMNLAGFYDKDVMELLKSYSEDIAEAVEDHGEGTARFQRELDERTAEFTRDFNELMRGRDEGLHDPAYESWVVRGFLHNHDESSIRTMGPRAQTLSRSYVRLFERWMGMHEDVARQCLDSNVREHYFQEFLVGLDESKDRGLADELRSGRIRRNSQRLLLQSAALLRQTGKEYVQSQADLLMSTIARTDMLYNSVEASNGSTGGSLP